MFSHLLCLKQTNYISKKNYYEKNIKNPKYLFFILKNKLLKSLQFCYTSHRDGIIWLLIGEGGYVRFMKNLQIMHINKT